MFGKTVEQPVKPRHVDALDAGVSQIDLQVCVGMNRVCGTRLAQRQRHFDALHADPVECNQGRGHFRQGNGLGGGCSWCRSSRWRTSPQGAKHDVGGREPQSVQPQIRYTITS